MSGKDNKPEFKRGGECVNKLNEHLRGEERAKAEGKVQVGNDEAHLQARAHERGADACAKMGRAQFGNPEQGHYGVAERAHGVAEAGLGGVKLDGGVGRTAYGYKNGDTDVKVVNWDAGGKLAAGAGGVAAKVDLQVDAAKVQTKHVDAHVGLSASSGAEVGPDGGSVKLLGLGAGVNSNGISFSTPIGGIGFKW